MVAIIYGPEIFRVLKEDLICVDFGTNEILPPLLKYRPKVVVDTGNYTFVLFICLEKQLDVYDTG